jgi:hypothetical protein
LVQQAPEAFFGTDHVNFNAAPGGVGRVSSSNSTPWVIPLTFDAPGAKTVTFKGKVQSGGTMLCEALAYDNSGTVVSSTGFIPFPVTGTFTSISLTLNTVPFGGTGVAAWIMTARVSRLSWASTTLLSLP